MSGLSQAARSISSKVACYPWITYSVHVWLDFLPDHTAAMMLTNHAKPDPWMDPSGLVVQSIDDGSSPGNWTNHKRMYSSMYDTIIDQPTEYLYLVVLPSFTYHTTPHTTSHHITSHPNTTQHNT